MSHGDPNPYLPPVIEHGSLAPSQGLILSPQVMKKVEAVIKDANQFWLAILLCFLCSGLGMILIGPWYLFRLIQWSSLSSTYPALVQSTAVPGSLPQRFQSAKWKLITGLVVGAILMMLFMFAFMLMFIGVQN